MVWSAINVGHKNHHPEYSRKR